MYILRTYIGGGGCEWDPVKAEANIEKHGVSFAEAAVALEDERAVTIEDEASQGEARWVTVGRAPEGEVVVVVFAWRGERVRSFQPERLRASNGGSTRRCHECNEKRVRFFERPPGARHSSR